MRSIQHWKMRLGGLVLLGFLSGGTSLLGQTAQGTIRGSVQDQSGGAIPGVTVLVTDAAGLKRTVVTDEWGNFEIAKIPAGRYTVEATLPGFRTFADNQVDLRPVEVRRVDIVLQVGEQTERITVTGEAAAVVQAEAPTVETGWQRELVEYLPQSRRSKALGGHSYLTATAGNAWMAVYGQRSQSSRLQLDGFDVGSQVHTAPPSDMWEEAKVVSLNSSAEYATATTFDFIMRRGTDEWTAMATLNSFNGALQATGWNPFRGPIAAGPDVNGRASGGGPVYIPKIYNGKGRTHFFAAFETFRFKGTKLDPKTVPSNPFRVGNFSQLLGFSKPVQLKNPFTGQPVPGNDLRNIPGFSVNRFAAGTLKFFPAPSRTPDVFASDNAGPFCQCNTSTFDQLAFSVDHEQGEKNHFGYRFQWYQRPEFLDSGASGCCLHGWQERLGTLRQKFNAVTWTRVLSPTFTNELRVGSNRFFNQSRPTKDITEIREATGLSGVPLAAAAIGRPNVNFLNSGINILRSFGESNTIQSSWTMGDNLIRVQGKHTLKFGGEVRTWAVNQLATSPALYGTFNFTGKFTGFDFADFLLGLPDTVTIASPRQKFYPRNQQLGLYFQDDFKMSPDLTLTLGVRWDVHGVAEDLRGLFFNYDPVTNALVVPDDRALQNLSPLFPAQKNGGPIPVLTAAQAGFPKGLREPDRNDIYPRLGFAWRPLGTNKLVVRGGYGIYTTPVEQGSNFGSLPTRAAGLFEATFDFTNTITGGVPLIRLPNAVPAGFAPGGGKAPFTPYSIDTLGIIKSYHNPYHQQWNLTIEREIPLRIAVGLGYIGGKSTGLSFQRDLNRPRPSPIPFTNSRRPLGSNFRNVRLVDNGGNQITHGMELKFRRRFGQSLGFNATYLWTSIITDAPDPSYFGPNDDLGFIIQDPLNRKGDRGWQGGAYGSPNSALPRHQIFIDQVWHVPIGRGRRWLNDLHPVADAILGGWVLSTIYRIGAPPGYATPVFTGFDPSNTDWRFSVRPDRICDGNIDNPWRVKWGQRIFDVDCFPIPPVNAGRFGTSGRAVLIRPQNPLSEVWQGIYKDIPLREKLRLRLSMQTSNFLNSAPPFLAFPNVHPSNINRGRDFPGGPRSMFVEASLAW